MRPILNHYHIAEGVSAFSTTRHGGESVGPFGAFNINPHCGDQPAHVAANRRLLAAELALAEPRIIVPHQVHLTESRDITADFLALPAEEQATHLEGVDALTTRCTAVCIGVSTADCIPVLLYDARHHAAAAVHAGWRGTVRRIVRQTLADMASRYGTRATDIVAVIGPGISRRNFEVGQEVYDAFAQAGHDMARIAEHRAKWHLDLPLCNRLQLEDAGVPADHITDCSICTYDAVDNYFSARRLGIASGRIYTGVVLR